MTGKIYHLFQASSTELAAFVLERSCFIMN